MMRFCYYNWTVILCLRCHPFSDLCHRNRSVEATSLRRCWILVITRLIPNLRRNYDRFDVIHWFGHACELQHQASIVFNQHDLVLVHGHCVRLVKRHERKKACAAYGMTVEFLSQACGNTPPSSRKKKTATLFHIQRRRFPSHLFFKTTVLLRENFSFFRSTVIVTSIGIWQALNACVLFMTS